MAQPQKRLKQDTDANDEPVAPSSTTPPVRPPTPPLKVYEFHNDDDASLPRLSTIKRKPNLNLFDFLVIELKELPRRKDNKGQMDGKGRMDVLGPLLGERMLAKNAHTENIVQRLLFYIAVNGDIYSMWNSSKSMRRIIRKVFAKNSPETALVMHSSRQWRVMSTKHWISGGDGSQDTHQCLDPSTFTLLVDIEQYKEIPRPRWTFYLYGFVGDSGHEKLPDVPIYVMKTFTDFGLWVGPSTHFPPVIRSLVKSHIDVMTSEMFSRYRVAKLQGMLFHLVRASLRCMGPWSETRNSLARSLANEDYPVGSDKHREQRQTLLKSFGTLTVLEGSDDMLRILHNPQARVTYSANTNEGAPEGTSGEPPIAPEYVRWSAQQDCLNSSWLESADSIRRLQAIFSPTNHVYNTALPQIRFYFELGRMIMAHTPPVVRFNVIGKHVRDSRSFVLLTGCFPVEFLDELDQSLL